MLPDRLTQPTYQFLLWGSLAFVLSTSLAYAQPAQNGSLDSTRLKNAIPAFEKQVERLRQHYHIPGISAGIVQGKALVWKKGFGFSDLENKRVPDEKTIYQIASLSKTFGSILLMQQVEAGRVSLEDPISKYGINLGARWGSDPRIRIKHLLTHTAMGNTWNGFKPGYSFRYNGDWYHQLIFPIEQASGLTYGKLFMQQIVRPLGLKNTVPSMDDSVDFGLTGYKPDSFRRSVAKPYDWQHGRLVPVEYRYAFGPAAGIMSNVEDLGKYAAALEEGWFLSPQSWDKVFTRFVTPSGKTIPYGLGWFIKYYRGVKVIWHTGWWTGYSALFVRIPEKNLTLILLANSQDLSRPFYHVLQPLPGLQFFSPFQINLGYDLMASDFARSFLNDVVGIH